MLVSDVFKVKWFTYVLSSLYPVSYLSKTILFLTFWTFANDIFNTSESKSAFPVIAAWGFAGGLAGACFARILLEIVPAEMVIALWALAYMVAYYFSRKMRHIFKDKLIPKEDLHENSTPGIKGIIGNVLALKLVRFMALLYFFIFLAIFSIDYLFWQKCHLWFRTSGSIASFQFSFYLVHGIVTIIELRLLLPFLISESVLPECYIFASDTIDWWITFECTKRYCESADVFWIVYWSSVFRYITFEIAFHPYIRCFCFNREEKKGKGENISGRFYQTRGDDYQRADTDSFKKPTGHDFNHGCLLQCCTYYNRI